MKQKRIPMPVRYGINLALTIAPFALIAPLIGPLLAVWLLDRWGQRTMIANAGKFSGTITQGDFGQGFRLVWEYFWHAEGLVLGLWLATAAFATWRVARQTRDPR